MPIHGKVPVPLMMQARMYVQAVDNSVTGADPLYLCASTQCADGHRSIPFCNNCKHEWSESKLADTS